ncbi:hypothetical protein QFC21_005382 [Naganishia friedmannii]|uniref:Uncharacterized protein n=1 Tax=Naganishia friedmannii TaxID=89922 RepID=A0ACC2VAB0_9TREE|nr:hypothetical protein QFC21_005382 [Naganishia friedmannii]
MSHADDLNKVVNSSIPSAHPFPIARHPPTTPPIPFIMMRNNSIRLAASLTSARTCIPATRSALSRLAPVPIASHRAIHTTRRLESGGLTNLFDTDDQGARPRLAVHKLNDEGFHLSDGLVIPGGVIFLENRAFLWDVDPVGTDELSGRGRWKEEGWSKDRFKIFETVVPRPEILLFGTGKSALPPPPDIREYISSLGISLDIMDSRNACSTFNLLSEEGRTVAAALMPLKKVDPRTGGAR